MEESVIKSTPLKPVNSMNAPCGIAMLLPMKDMVELRLRYHVSATMAGATGAAGLAGSLMDIMLRRNMS